jgi:hypothetical protein
MNKSKSTPNYLRYIAIILAIVSVASISLFVLDMWDRNQDVFEEDVIETLGDSITYDGKEYVLKNNIETMNKCCPMDGVSKREDMKNLIHTLQKDIPMLKTNIYGAIKRSNIKGWNKQS